MYRVSKAHVNPPPLGLRSLIGTSRGLAGRPVSKARNRLPPGLSYYKLHLHYNKTVDMFLDLYKSRHTRLVKT